MFKVALAAAEPDPTGKTWPGGRGTTAKWAISRDSCGSVGGIVGLVTMEPHTDAPLHCVLNADAMFYVIDGQGSLTDDTGRQRQLARHSAAFLAAGTRSGITAGEQPLAMVVLYSGVGSPTDLAWSEPSSESGPTGTEAGQRSAADASVLQVDAMSRGTLHDPARGFFHMATTRLVDAHTHPTATMIVGQTLLTAQTRHAVHRHPGAGEFVLMLDGYGHQLTESEEIDHRAGELVYVPPGTWHGLRGPAAEETATVLWGYLGVGSMPQVGYELATAAHSEDAD